MPTSITRDQLIAMRPCYLNKHLARFNKRKSMTIRQAFNSGATIPDLLWVAGQLGHTDLCVKFALACAVRAGRFTKDRRVHDCLAATQTYIDDSSEANLAALRVARRNAANADAAADAAANAAANADAANAAAYAAAYADAAANAAANAADAYAAAAYAAYAAAYAAEYQKEIKAQQAIFIKLFA